MLNVKCPICRGKGRIPAEKSAKKKDMLIPCSECSGTGLVNFDAISEELRELVYRQNAS